MYWCINTVNIQSLLTCLKSLSLQKYIGKTCWAISNYVLHDHDVTMSTNSNGVSDQIIQNNSQSKFSFIRFDENFFHHVHKYFTKITVYPVYLFNTLSCFDVSGSKDFRSHSRLCFLIIMKSSCIRATFVVGTWNFNW